MNQANVKAETTGPTRDQNKTEQNPEDDYDPHLYRVVARPTTNFDTLVNLLRATLGTGILAMPEAFKFAGMINGIVSTILMGALCTYCYHILVKGQYILCKRLKVGLLTYPESMKAACEMGPSCLRRIAPYAPGITNFFLIVYQLGCCCVYVVFVGRNMQYIGDVYTPHKLSIYVYMSAIFVPFLLILCVRNLKLLSPFSTLANLISVVTFTVVFYYVFQNLDDFHDRPAVGNVMGYALYFGTTIFALQAVGVVVAVENNMATPKNFRKPWGVLNIGMGIATLIYTAIGMMGYWRYGEKIESSITMNFPITEALAQTIIISYSLSIVVTYGVQGYVGYYILWADYILPKLKDKGEKMKIFYEYLVRCGCVIITFVLAMTVPLLGLVLSLVGSFCLSTLGIAFPAMIELCAYWPEKSGPKTGIFWKDVFIIIVGVLGLCSGCYSAVHDIVEKLAAGDY